MGRTTRAIRVLVAAVTGLAAASAGGCFNRYAVTDEYSKRVYFTRQVNAKDDGSKVFTDARSGRKMTLRSAKVRRVSTGEFSAAVDQ